MYISVLEGQFSRQQHWTVSSLSADSIITVWSRCDCCFGLVFMVCVVFSLTNFEQMCPTDSCASTGSAAILYNQESARAAGLIGALYLDQKRHKVTGQERERVTRNADLRVCLFLVLLICAVFAPSTVQCNQFCIWPCKLEPSGSYR